MDIKVIAKLAQEKSISYVKELFNKRKVIAAGWYVGDGWRENEDQYQQLLSKLPRLTQISINLDCRRCYIWMPNWSDERDYTENFKWHVKRLRPVVDVLKDYGLRFGLEWQGTKSLRVGRKYEFIHSMKETLDLVGQLDQDSNVGLLLDSWHMFTANDGMELITNLNKDQVVYIHICDAPKGIPVDDLQDLVREAPGVTGVIDLPGFIRGLKEIGYDGPIEPSIPLVPKDSVLENTTAGEAANINSKLLDKLFQQAQI